ncbi:prolipoprotein diacylglyceryl transferase [Novispirillum sp. DQ9]|uniref:prolipoprotein diacylglyceryl transferase n=1 Tax=Novispirillum sp. DQ9 TaxID=3398612 RepID=UPI003C7CFC15
MLFALPFPAIDPVAVAIGPVAIRWYALAYIAGLLIGWWSLVRLERRTQGPLNAALIDDFFVWVVAGVVAGGRLGYVLFYNLPFYLDNPVQILKVWEGGMSFHGGMLGVIVAILLFARRRGLHPFVLGDRIATVVPIGLFFGRIANFVNGELFGRVAPDVPWAMVFPHGGPEPRHPSQLYQAGMEGLVLLVLMLVLYHRDGLRNRPGFLAGAFLAGYGLVRLIGEVFRQPDAHLGFLFAGATMGQLLSLPMIAIGVGLMTWAARRPATPPVPADHG